MSTSWQEESIAERARRALSDNPEFRSGTERPDRPMATEQEVAAGLATVVEFQPPTSAPAAEPAPAQAAAPADDYPSLVAHRLRAIALVRELQPKRRCYQLRVKEMSERLMRTPGESVHYTSVLRWLGEAHEELRRLDGRIEAAQHVLRTTEWLVEMLADPFGAAANGSCEPSTAVVCSE